MGQATERARGAVREGDRWGSGWVGMGWQRAGAGGMAAKEWGRWVGSLGWVEEASSNEKVVVNVEGKTRGGAGGEAQVEWS